MRTVGVDLAAQPATTAAACLTWSAAAVTVDSVVVGQTDADLRQAAAGAAKVGIDCPLGWPEPFIEFVTAHRDRRPLAAHDLAGRRDLAYRLTDQTLIATAGLRPLSVSADLIGHAAMRAAGLLAGLTFAGYDVDRAGAGLVVEAYPAAALHRWDLPHRGYKGAAGAHARIGLVERLDAALPISWFGHDALCRVSDHALDAVVCALVARAAALGRTTRPSPVQLDRAATEGWIGVPTCGLAELMS